MSQRRRCKVLATVGPASWESEKLEEMIEAGVDGFRFNFSHGSVSDFLPLVKKIRQKSEEASKPVACLADLQGPKIRLGELKDERRLESGEEVEFHSGEDESDGPGLPINLDSLLTDLEEGHDIFIADGQIQLKVKEVGKTGLRAEVVYGGDIGSNKGVNLPDSDVSLPALTAEDREELERAVNNDFDMVALSFVRSAADLQPVQKIIKRANSQIDLVAKIETERALVNLDEILSQVEGVMVARGDLGVEIGHKRVPYQQKEIIRRANSRGKFVITATQMLESMVKKSTPTRAETSDVANAVLDGSDTVMLSGETAVGAYPLKSVETMIEIIETTESDFKQRLKQLSMEVERPGEEISVSMVNAAARCAREINARAVVIPTFSGSTARMISNTYTPCPLIALCASQTTLQKTALYRNVYSCPLEVIEDTDELVGRAKQTCGELELVSSGDKIVLLAGLPLAEPGITNLIHVIEI